MRKELKRLATRLRDAIEASEMTGTTDVAEPEVVAPTWKPPKPTAPAPRAAPPTATEIPVERPAEGGYQTASGRYIVRVVVAPKVRADLLVYAGLHCGGQMYLIRVLPHGVAEGKIDGNEFQSLFLAGPHGTRVTLCTHDGEDWMDHPWRTIKLLPGKSFTAKNGKPAVRVPDLDFLDRPDARRAESESQQSYPFAESREKGEGWTFGRPGPMKNRVRVVYVDKE